MKKIYLKEIIEFFPDVLFVGDPNDFIDRLIIFNATNSEQNVLMWANISNLNKIKDLEAGTIITPEIPVNERKASCNYFFTDTPRKMFGLLLKEFLVEKRTILISKKASIHSSVIIGTNCSIGDHCVIHQNVIIGNDVSIGDNTVIYSNVLIGNDVVIGSNNTIGGVGFGYEKDDSGEYILMPHIGNVIIMNKVEIGNNTAIDRAVLGSTILNENVKVDNLVHIAHGVQIGKNSLIIANAMIAGSSIIGENVWIAPSCSILNKLSIGDNSVVGLGAVVLKDVEEGTKVVGNPAKPLNK